MNEGLSPDGEIIMTPEFVTDELCEALDSAPEPLVLIDGAGRIAFVSAQVEHVFGYDRAELIGAPAAVLIPEWAQLDDWGAPAPVPPVPQSDEWFVLAALTDISTHPGEAPPHGAVPSMSAAPQTRPLRTSPLGRPPEHLQADAPGTTEAEPVHPAGTAPPAAGEEPVVRAEARYLHRDGHSLWGVVTAARMRVTGGRDRPGLAPPRGGSAPKPAEAEARSSAARFQALFDTGGVGMVEASHDHRITAANHAFCSMTGYTAAELIGMAVPDVLFPEDRAHVLAQFDAAAAGRVPVYEAERRYRRKDGSALWARVSARAREGGENPAGVSAVVIDLTDRKRLEEQLRSVEAVELRASCLAHDFNNLLTVINGCAGLLLDGAPEAGPVRDLVLEMTAACQRGTGLTARLLAVSRKAPIEPRVLDLNEVVAGAIRLLRRLTGPNLTLVSNMADRACGIKADPTQLEQAILNLAINAKDAMPQGGTLSIETRGVRVRAEDRPAYPNLPPGEYVQLTVSDTGAGMTDAVKARAFEPFFTTKGVGKGTGLGLAAVRTAVTQCGGCIAVHSELGLGTIIEILLPAVTTPSIPPDSQAQLVPRCAGTVLLVGEAGAARALTGLALRGHGYEMIEAANGAEALQRARDHAGPIDLLLTGVSDQELADALRVRHPDIKTLSLTGDADTAVRSADHQSAAPVTPISLINKVRVLTDKRA